MRHDSEPLPGEPEPLHGQLVPRSSDLLPTEFIDSGSETVLAFVARVSAGAADQHEVAAKLFAAVRDGVRYDPYTMPAQRSDYRASAVLEAGSGYCIQKAVALTAAARAAGIPSRLGFADVKNHLQSERLRETMGTDLFVWHGYSTLYVGGRWTKASCAFNAELCARFGVAPLDYDGHEDALLHPFTGDGGRYMEYVRDRGVYVDLPLRRVMSDFAEVYGWTGAA